MHYLLFVVTEVVGNSNLSKRALEDERVITNKQFSRTCKVYQRRNRTGIEFGVVV